MKIESVRVIEGKLLLEGEDRELYLRDGIYRRDDGETITIRGHRVINVLTVPDLNKASKKQLEDYIDDLKQQLSTVGDDAQLANIDLQNMLQKQQQTLQTLSSVSKALHDTALAVVRKIG